MSRRHKQSAARSPEPAATNQQEPMAGDVFQTTPPRRRPWLLAIAIALEIAWLIFLAILALAVA